jgi:nucleoside-triphosphatase THEP1
MLRGKSNEYIALEGKIEVLAGNHLQDFNLFREKDQVLSVVSREIKKGNNDNSFKVTKTQESERTFYESPRFIEIAFGKFYIEFLDFNSPNLHFFNKTTNADYIKCTWSPDTVSPMEAKLYAFRVADNIKKFTLITNNVTYRGIRMSGELCESPPSY